MNTEHARMLKKHFEVLEALTPSIPSNTRVFWFLVCVLARCDKEYEMGISRQDWLRLCGQVYDKVRASLNGGPSA